MNFIRAIRSAEWWEYKLPALLALAYATAVQAGSNLFEAALWIAFLLLSIIVGAVYVSLINDLTDIKEDAASGKHNRMAGLPPAWRWTLLSVSVAAGSVCAYFLATDTLTLTFYLLSYVSFTLYSVPPFRFKSKGIQGVLADACGAHLFPSLTMVAGTAYYLQIPFNGIWFTAVGAWALMYGMRGILWHQFTDRSNDQRIGLRTFATQHDPDKFKVYASVILAVELAALAVMLVYIGKLWPVIGLSAYLLLLAGYSKKFGMKLIAIIPPAGQSWHIIMISFYQAFFPLSLLLEAALTHSLSWIVLAVHLCLFPRCVWNILSDGLVMFNIRGAKKPTT